MKYIQTWALATSLVLGCTHLAQASHANPWATADDTLLSKYHDENQARSVDTPGEDEMRGGMERAANGKTSGVASDNSGGKSEGGKGRKGRSR